MVFTNNAIESGANNFAAFLELAKRSLHWFTSGSGLALSALMALGIYRWGSMLLFLWLVRLFMAG